MQLAWVTAMLPRAKRPRFERLLQREPTKPQTMRQQIAAARHIALMFGGAIINKTKAH